MYVVDINPFRNEVVLGDLEDLLNTKLIAKDTNYIPFDT